MNYLSAIAIACEGRENEITVTVNRLVNCVFLGGGVWVIDLPSFHFSFDFARPIFRIGFGIKGLADLLVTKSAYFSAPLIVTAFFKSSHLYFFKVNCPKFVPNNAN